MAMNKQTKYGHPEGYDYLKDVRAFGDAIILALIPNDLK